MTNNLEDEIRAIVTGMDSHENQDNTQTPQEEVHDVYVLIVRESEEAEDQVQVVESTPTQPFPVTMQHDSFLSTYVFVCCSLFLLLSTLAFQCYCIFNPPIATVTIIPTSKTVTLSGTLQLGRVLPPLTIYQSQTTATTGKGHQDARVATGYITFYNGLFTSQTIAAGTILTGASGIEVVIDELATIPAGNPPSYGQVSVSAHAINPGVRGNIPAYDISQACCSSAVLVKNTASFTGGLDERHFSTVRTQDMHKISTPLRAAVIQSMQGALQGQLNPNEQLQILPCTPTVISDHQPGQEAMTVKVTVSETCSAVAYNNQELQIKATSFLATQAQHKTGTGYSIFRTVQVSVKQASVASTTPHLVFLSFQATGIWKYGISNHSQEQIKHLIAGKTTQEAEQLLAKMSGVEQSTIRLTGFGDNSRMPKQSSNIHISLIVM